MEKLDEMCAQDQVIPHLRDVNENDIDVAGLAIWRIRVSRQRQKYYARTGKSDRNKQLTKLEHWLHLSLTKVRLRYGDLWLTKLSDNETEMVTNLLMNQTVICSKLLRDSEVTFSKLKLNMV